MAIDLAALRKKHEEMLKKNSGGSNSDFLEKFLTVELGETTIRILPWINEEREFYAETSIHRIPTGNGGNPKNYHCPKVQGDPCPICEVYYSLWKTGRKEDEVLARAIKPRARYYLNVYDRESEEVKILSIGTILFQKITSTILDPDYGDITDTKAGHDFKIVKYMEGEWPKYDQSAPRPKPTPLAKSDAAIAAILEGCHDIHKLVEIKDNEILKAVAANLAIQGFHSGEQTAAAAIINNETESAPVETDNSEENFIRKLRTKE